MRISRQTVEHVQAGGLTVSIDYEADGQTVADVAINDGDRSVVIGAELLERAALILRSRRLEHGNRDYVCATHGYVSDEECELCTDDAREALR